MTIHQWPLDVTRKLRTYEFIQYFHAVAAGFGSAGFTQAEFAERLERIAGYRFSRVRLYQTLIEAERLDIITVERSTDERGRTLASKYRWKGHWPPMVF